MEWWNNFAWLSTQLQRRIGSQRRNALEYAYLKDYIVHLQSFIEASKKTQQLIAEVQKKKAEIDAEIEQIKKSMAENEAQLKQLKQMHQYRNVGIRLD